MVLKVNILKEVCLGIGERYEIQFIEMGTDEDPVTFLIQSVPAMAISKIVKIIKKDNSKRSI